MTPRPLRALALAAPLLAAAPALAAELIADAQVVAAKKAGAIPQAPRLSPDGGQLAFEYYTSGKKVAVWLAKPDGADARCLTCDLGAAYENAYWHPSGKYLLVNEVPSGGRKDGSILVLEPGDGGVRRREAIAHGARAQFSRPNGSVVFFERTEDRDGRAANVLAYTIVGADPFALEARGDHELRGPIEKVNRSTEVSHPSLGPDGTTIVFAARIGVLGMDDTVLLDDGARQKVYQLWKRLLSEPDPPLLADGSFSLETCSWEDLGTDASLQRRDKLWDGAGFTVGDFTRACVLGVLKLLDPRKDTEVRELLLPRLWTTDVFGAPITPLVKDSSSAPLPQKWATLSRDGRFAVFEAGLYTERHIYLIMKRNGAWMSRAVRLTSLGTYNSSPELDATGQWLYFESDRKGGKALWRARLDWPAIERALGAKP